MIDLNPYFKKKLGDTLVFNTKMGKYIMDVISTTDIPNVVHLEVSSLPHQEGVHEWTYHGVVEIDLNHLQSVRTVQKAVVACLENPSKAINAKKII